MTASRKFLTASSSLWLPPTARARLPNRIEKLLTAQGRHTYLLDGDNVRHGLNKDLGFTAQDRVENIRRAGGDMRAGQAVLPFSSVENIA